VGLTLRTASHRVTAMAKNPAAVELGRKGGKARVKKQTPDQRTASARNAAQARWAKKKGK
jgi:hypothetical protein